MPRLRPRDAPDRDDQPADGQGRPLTGELGLRDHVTMQFAGAAGMGQNFGRFALCLEGIWRLWGRSGPLWAPTSHNPPNKWPWLFSQVPHAQIATLDASLTTQVPWVVFRGDPRPDDIFQGGVGNCWLVCAMSCLAETPELIKKIILTPEYNPAGAYQVRLCHAGEWKIVTVDDVFPTNAVRRLRLRPAAPTPARPPRPRTRAPARPAYTRMRTRVVRHRNVRITPNSCEGAYLVRVPAAVRMRRMRHVRRRSTAWPTSRRRAGSCGAFSSKRRRPSCTALTRRSRAAPSKRHSRC